MKYKMFKPFVSNGASSAVERVLLSGYLNEGVEVSEFSGMIEDFIGIPATMTNSGTSAIQIALKLSGMSPGDFIITPSMTCVATSQAISWGGGVPFWVDITPKFGCPSAEQVEFALNCCPRAKAVVVVSWGGVPPDLARIKEITSSKGVKLIHDAAHAFGSEIDGLSVAHLADFTCFSFQAIKHLTTGDGGAVVCLDPKLRALAEKSKWFGIDRFESKDESGEWKGQRWEIDVDSPGSKMHMNNIAAAIGVSNMAHVDEIMSKYRRNHKILEDGLEGVLPSIKSPVPGANSSCWVYTGLTDPRKRDKHLKSIRSYGVDAGLVHVPNHVYSLYEGSMMSLPGTEEFSSSQISLPCNWSLSEHDMKEIVSVVLEVMG